MDRACLRVRRWKQLVDSKLAESGVKGRFFRGTAWIFLGNVAERDLSALSGVPTARLLGPVRFGEYGIVQNTERTITVYAGLRMSATPAKLVAEHLAGHRDEAERILRLSLFVSLLSCLLISAARFIFSPAIATHSLNRPDELSRDLAIGAILIFFLLYGGVQENELAGFEYFS